MITEKKPEDKDSITFNYPTWISVRNAYRNRRNTGSNAVDIKDPYELPEKYLVTKTGSIKLQLDKKITQDDM